MKPIKSSTSQDVDSVYGGFGQSGSTLVKTERDAEFQTIAIIDARNLERECFVRSLEISHAHLSIVGYRSIAQMKEQLRSGEPLAAVILNIGSREASQRGVADEIRYLVSMATPTPVIVLAESEDLREMIAAIDCGARGYIPASVGIDVIIEATRLTSGGGIFLPTTSILSLRDAIFPKREAPSLSSEQFTSRQSAVANALRRGKANKVIAYGLNMSESTVKVHVRNIMRKLKATNRTEVAFKLNASTGEGDSGLP